MSARSVQISLDEELLALVDRQKETRQHGRSAFIRRALVTYLELERRRDVDAAYARGYAGKANAVARDFAELLGGQAWPEK